MMTQVGQRPHDAVVTPTRVLAGEANHQFLHLGGNPGAARMDTTLGAIELAGDEPRYQAGMVSGLAAQATFSRALRPSRLPISASVRRSGSDRRSRAGKCPRRTRFSAARYSFWRSSSWFTSPVTYARRRAH